MIVDAKINYIHPLPHLSDNLKFPINMKYIALSLCDLLAPILHAATVALGGAIPGCPFFGVEKGITARLNQVHPAIRFWMHFLLSDDQAAGHS